MPREHKIQIVVKKGKINARITWVENGKRKALWRSGSTKTEARDRLRQALHEKESLATSGRYGPQTKFSIVMQWYLDRYAIAPVYVDERKIAGLRSGDSVRGYARALNAVFANQGIGTISHSDLESYKIQRLRGQTRRGKGRSIASVHRELALVRRLFNIAEREGWITKSPFRKGDALISIADERRGSRIMSFDEEERLLKACTGRIAHLRAIIICAVDTGMRAGELFSLHWTDIHRGYIQLSALSTKTMQARQVPISDRLREEFNRLWDKSLKDESASVFSVTTVKRAFKTGCERSGIAHGEPLGLSLRCLRRTASTRWIQSGVSREEVSKVLGHSRASEIPYQHYLTADETTLGHIRDVLNAMNQNAPPLRDVR